MFPQYAATHCSGGAANAVAEAIVQRDYGGRVDFTGALNGIDAASCSSAPRIASSRPSVTALGSSAAVASCSRDVPRSGAAPRLHRTTVTVLEFPATPVCRHIFLTLPIAPAERCLLSHSLATTSPQRQDHGEAPVAPTAGVDDASREPRLLLHTRLAPPSTLRARPRRPSLAILEASWSGTSPMAPTPPTSTSSHSMPHLQALWMIQLGVPARRQARLGRGVTRATSCSLRTPRVPLSRTRWHGHRHTGVHMSGTSWSAST
jgi:hypothetical protein